MIATHSVQSEKTADQAETFFKSTGKIVAFALVMLTLASCGFPRSGPNKSEIFAASEAQGVPIFVVPVDERVNQVIPEPPVLLFPSALVNTSTLTPGVIRPGDTLAFTIYESVETTLFPGGSQVTSLDAIQVDDSGFIFIPYAGRIRAAGNSPERVRQIVTERLDEKTPDPEVIVQRSAGDGGTVSVVGSGIAQQGTYPLQRSNLKLLGLVANAGGVAGDPETVRIIITRGSKRAEMWADDVYNDPKFDIALRPGDRIVVERDNRSFTSLGQTSSEGLVPFERRNLSALEAIARSGGISDESADPTGIFIIRDEAPNIANDVLGRSDFATEQRLVYVLDLTKPGGLFLARNFEIQDGDTVYVTQAPFTQFARTLGLVVRTAIGVQAVENIVSN